VPVRDALWAVAGRFAFAEAELLAMPVGRLRFWYDGHRRMVEEERAAMQGLARGQ